MPDILQQLVDFVTQPGVVLIGAITLIEVTPIKLNPWKWLFTIIGNLLYGDMRKDIKELKRDFEETKAQDKRWHILNFANNCRNGKLHSREEWNHVISELAEYEAYTEAKDITNGVIEENSKYLRALYQERIKRNDFI